MGYRIVYSPQMNKKYPMVKTRMKSKNRILVFACVLLIILEIAKLDKSGRVKQFLLPGDPTLNEQAMTAFVENVRSGEPVPEAVSAFCRQIIENAQES